MSEYMGQGAQIDLDQFEGESPRNFENLMKSAKNLNQADEIIKERLR